MKMLFRANWVHAFSQLLSTVQAHMTLRPWSLGPTWGWLVNRLMMSIRPHNMQTSYMLSAPSSLLNSDQFITPVIHAGTHSSSASSWTSAARSNALQTELLQRVLTLISRTSAISFFLSSAVISIFGDTHLSPSFSSHTLCGRPR